MQLIWRCVSCAGLCQAKIAAAELWRAYSEHYRSHQARHPMTPASRHHQQHQQQQIQPRDVTDAGRCTDIESISLSEPSQSMKASIAEPGDVGQSVGSPDRSRGGGELVDDVSGRLDNDDVIRTDTGCEMVGEGSIASSNSNNDDVDDDFELEGIDASADLGSGNAVWNGHEDDRNVGPTLTPLSIGVMRCAAPLTTEDHNSTAILTNTDSDGVASLNATITSNSTSILPQNVRLMSDAVMSSLSQGFTATSGCQEVRTSTVHEPYNANVKTEVKTELRLSSAISPNSNASAPKTLKKLSSERQSSSVDYRRSERGLSYLFPSFSDHGISLLDKVRITVARHKNNYFLGWSADQLSRLDPIVRPKVPVTPAVYREYCHRNAMKYDSNLQFACESPEPWAAEFRARLTLPPAEGGFSSLCEVKLEAGRLWREHSGRYRMHNIVKWQMGMNSAVLANGCSSSAATAAAAAAVMKPGRTRSKTSPSAKAEQFASSHVEQRRLSTSAATTFGQNRLTSDDVTRHAVSAASTALSVTAPSSTMMINPGPFFVDPACSTPKFAGLLCLTSTAAAASVGRLDSSTSSSSCSDVLDMSISAPSAAVSGDSGPLFEPLPDDMSAASQLRVWLERHRCGYFVNAPPPPSKVAAADPVADYVRPRRWPVTPALLSAEIPPGVVEVLDKIDHLLSLSVDQLPAAARFRERLNAPAGSDDAFATFEEAVTEALSAYRTALGQDVFSSNGVEGSGVASRHRKRKRNRPEYVSYSGDAGCTSPINVRLSSGDGSRPPTSDDDDDDDGGGGLVVALSPSGSPSPASGQSHSPSASLSVEAVQQLLWSSRSSLYDACVQNPQLSWNERLETLRPTLTANVGADYVAPSRSDAATVDLVLALLHRRLDDLARSQTRLGDHDRDQLQPKQDALPR